MLEIDGPIYYTERSGAPSMKGLIFPTYLSTFQPIKQVNKHNAQLRSRALHASNPLPTRRARRSHHQDSL